MDFVTCRASSRTQPLVDNLNYVCLQHGSGSLVKVEDGWRHGAGPLWQPSRVTVERSNDVEDVMPPIAAALASESGPLELHRSDGIHVSATTGGRQQ